MSLDAPFDGEITTANEFEAALDQILRAAAGTDVDPRGSWEYRRDDGTPDMEVMIHELEKRDMTE